MKHFYFIFSRLALFISVAVVSPSCHSVDEQVRPETIEQVLNHYLQGAYISSTESVPIFKQADFNGDGRLDLAVLITPVELPVNQRQVIISQPWNVFERHKAVKGPSKPYRRSLLIVQPTGPDWLSEDARVDLLVDTEGVMETPSFELLVISKSSLQQKDGVLTQATGLHDALILPTEAGIDTYIYWNGSGFELHQPDEVP